MEYQTRSRDTRWVGWVGGIALGALAMYVADPVEGRRRRALLQDKVTHYTKQTQRRVGAAVHDARNRLTGLQAEAMRLTSMRQAKPIDNHVLEARVRYRLSRAFPDTEGLSISADRGVIMLGGQISEAIEHQLIEMVGGIPGVESVSYQRQMTHQAGNRLSSIFAGRSPIWIASALGAGLLTWYGLTRLQPLGLIAAATGMGLLTRSGHLHESVATMTDESTLAFDAERSIDINASPEAVYDVCSRYESFPHFMANVIDVRDLGNHRSHWVVQGAGGSDVEFDSRLTDSDRPRRISWRSEPGSTVDSEGMIALQAHAGGTRATVRMSWRPPVGAVGKGVAVLTGTDAGSALDEDLQRMKQFIEHGQPPRESTDGSAVLH